MMPGGEGTASLHDIFRSTGLATLDQNSPLDAVEAALERLADRCRGEATERIEILRDGAVRALKAAGVTRPARLVDLALGGGSEKPEDSTGLIVSDARPWPQPVDGAELLDDLAEVFQRFVVLPVGAAAALSLWVLHTFTLDAFDASPFLNVTSPTKRCGKTTLILLLEALVRRALSASSISAAALFRVVERCRPTLLIDEADATLDGREELRGIINGSNLRSGGVIRCVGDDHEPTRFSTWCPKVLAGIRQRSDTIADRSITIALRRKTPGEAVERWRTDRAADFELHRRRALRWAQDNLDALRAADPDVPVLGSDRAADNWRPLLAIADLADGAWPEKARTAALELSGGGDDTQEAAVLLLGDLRRLFEQRRADRLTSAEVVEDLAQMEDRPWPEWRRGQPISQRGLARLLDGFGIKPRPMDWGGRHSKGTRGYGREDFADAFSRYLPQEGGPKRH